MTILTDKIILLTGCSLLLLLPVREPGLFHVLSLLSAIIFSCFLSCCNTEFNNFHPLSEHINKIYGILCILFLVLTLFLPPLKYYLPCLVYEMTALFLQMPTQNQSAQKSAVSDTEQNCSFNIIYRLCFLCLAAVLIVQVYRHSQPLLLSLLCILACYLSWKSRQFLLAKYSLHLLRDTSAENQILLRQKNQNLIQKQDYEIHVATLKERNRIAREIHDNVGHLLSRSLLQAGALIAVNQQKQLEEPLHALKLTLNSAMDSIRESVHDLHGDSIDLENSIQELLSDFTDYQINLDYDMRFSVPSNIKYCFISIVKEALSNIVRHSSASAISITMREHPLLYQLVISDNGTTAGTFQPGMGITNMEQRIKHFNGNFSISTEHGFRIFISVPISHCKKGELT